MSAQINLPSAAQLKNRLETSFSSFRNKMLVASDFERHTNYGIAIGILSAMYSANILDEEAFDSRVETLGKEL